MSRLTEREIARKLSAREDFEPPADLLARLKGEIPSAVAVGVQGPDLEKEAGMPLRQRWLIAASLLAMVGAGLVAFQASLMPRGEEAVSEAPRESAEMASQEAAPEEAAPGAHLEARPAPAPPAEESLAEPARPEETRSEAPFLLPPPPPPPASPKLEIAADMAAEGGVEEEMAGGVVGGVVGGVPGNAPAPPASIPGADATRRMILDQRRSSTGSVISREELERLPVAPAPSAVSRSAPGNLAGRLSPGGEGKPYADTHYKSAGVNPFVDAAVDRLSTFGLDVDTGSYTVARRYLADGNLPDPASVRVEEYVNFFDYGDAPPRQGDFAIRAEGAPSPFTEGGNHRLLRFNIRGREVRADDRRPAVLTFVVDVSGSMDQENRLGLVKKSLSLLLDQLQPADRVGLVTYGDDARVLLEPTGDKEAVRRAIELLRPEGSTNAEAGLLAGYDVAGRHFRLNAANRIVLCSDGVANVGRTGPLSILGRIGREARRGIELTTLGFGMGNYNDDLMEQLANRGDGRYAYIDTLDEAKRVLVEEVTGTLQTIARNAKVQVEFNPAVAARYRLLGYENRDIADARFRDETVDAGEVGAGHSVTALYEVELKPGAPGDGLIATLHLRYKTPEIGNVTETAKKLRVADLAPAWERASPGFRLASLVAEFAEILKQSPWAKGSDLREVLRRSQAVAQELAGGKKADQVTEFVELVGRAARAKRGEVEE